jgi:hypothetical protein
MLSAVATGSQSEFDDAWQQIMSATFVNGFPTEQTVFIRDLIAQGDWERTLAVLNLFRDRFTVTRHPYDRLVFEFGISLTAPDRRGFVDAACDMVEEGKMPARVAEAMQQTLVKTFTTPREARDQLESVCRDISNLV